MRGVIGNREAVSHLGLIWREFGPKCTVRCIGAMLGRRRNATFLDIALGIDRARPARRR
jgi:hypothetical protein